MSNLCEIKEKSCLAAQAEQRKGVELLKAGKVSESVTSLNDALQLDLNCADAWANLGVALRKLGKTEASVACLTRALELSPRNPFYLANYSNCLADLNRFEEALEANADAIRLRPDHLTFRHNLAIKLRNALYSERAIAYFKEILKDHPHNVEVLWDMALTQLQMGDFKNGWENFEVRWKRPSMRRERDIEVSPRWNGEDIKGKTLLVYEEQGFGDAILCSRYISLIHQRGGNIILECRATLHRLFSALPGVVRITEAGQVTSGFDYHVPMMSLPRIFGTDLTSIPPLPSLYVASVLPPALSRLLDSEDNVLKIGIVWSGNIDFPDNRKRAVEVTRFLPLAAMSGVQLYSLQKGPLEIEVAACGADGLILATGQYLEDFADTAAVLKKLDLVIMTDSSVAHLAGSLSVPVWNLLSYCPYWLYLLDRFESPWYPSMRLFRQQQPGNWDTVFEKVIERLTDSINCKSEGEVGGNRFLFSGF